MEDGEDSMLNGGGHRRGISRSARKQSRLGNSYSNIEIPFQEATDGSSRQMVNLHHAICSPQTMRKDILQMGAYSQDN